MKDGPPSAGHDLLGMEMDFFVLLGELDQVDGESVSVHRTEHPERLIVATCRPAAGFTLAAAAAAVRDLWLSNLRYNHREAHELHVSEDGARLDFVTQIGPKAFYVTGQVAISAA